MAELGWREAILQVLQDSPKAMHYADIAEEIVTRELRVNVGATPSATVNWYICTSLNNKEDQSPFIRVDRGYYWLRGKAEDQGGSDISEVSSEVAGEDAGTGLINAFGMYWARDQVLWAASAPKLFGKQLNASQPVDFCEQKGVYLLHDGRSVVYVGRTTDQPLGVRLRQHTIDRLNGRWDRFSWFGIYAVDKSGTLNADEAPQFDVSMLIATMEALLIEGLEPPQNRKRGDDFRAVEFLQVLDPDIKRKQVAQLMSSVLERLPTLGDL